jgi:menaquinone-dependent protoporphyrinogen oxidase
MIRILIIYASVDGQTKKISEYIATKRKKTENEIITISIENVESINIDEYDEIVIGAAIRYGKFNKKIYKFIEKNKQLLSSKVNAFFIVNATARKRGKDNPSTNSYAAKFIKRSQWQPQNIAIFAGRINYSKYNFFDRAMIKFIMKITKGPTEQSTNIEFTNWQKVDEFCSILET